jgi:hypothetical protein
VDRGVNMSNIEHEVRLRLLEERQFDMKETFKNINENLNQIRIEMKSQFTWTIMLVFGFIGVVILPVVGSEIIGLIKLIHTL